jgi:hypothetical protein
MAAGGKSRFRKSHFGRFTTASGTLKKPPAGEDTIADGNSLKYNKKERLSRHFRILIIVLSWQITVI